MQQSTSGEIRKIIFIFRWTNITGGEKTIALNEYLLFRIQIIVAYHKQNILTDLLFFSFFHTWGAKRKKRKKHCETFTWGICQISPLLTRRCLPLSPSLCSSSLLGSWSARSCRSVPVHSFRTKCVCDSPSTFAILARVNFDSVSLVCLFADICLSFFFVHPPCIWNVSCTVCACVCVLECGAVCTQWQDLLFSRGLLYSASLSPCRVFFFFFFLI